MRVLRRRLPIKRVWLYTALLWIGGLTATIVWSDLQNVRYSYSTSAPPYLEVLAYLGFSLILFSAYQSVRLVVKYRVYCLLGLFAVFTGMPLTMIAAWLSVEGLEAGTTWSWVAALISLCVAGGGLTLVVRSDSICRWTYEWIARESPATPTGTTTRRCRHCDYDLAGLNAQAVCPECGQTTVEWVAPP